MPEQHHPLEFLQLWTYHEYDDSYHTEDTFALTIPKKAADWSLDRSKVFKSVVSDSFESENTKTQN